MSPPENILLVDRQTSVGVDIAEQTAAKTALENAAGRAGGACSPQTQSIAHFRLDVLGGVSNDNTGHIQG